MVNSIQCAFQGYDTIDSDDLETFAKGFGGLLLGMQLIWWSSIIIVVAVIVCCCINCQRQKVSRFAPMMNMQNHFSRCA